MSHRRTDRAPGWLLLALAGALLLGGLPAQPARAAGYDKAVNSLALVPADAAFYNAMLRNREQVQIIAHSKAWARLRELPAFQLAWKQVQDQYNQDEGKLAVLRKLYEQPENRDLVAMLRDAVANEVFFYGASSCSDFTELALQSYGAIRYGPLLAPLEGKTGNPGKLQARAVLRILAAEPDRIKVPDLVIGFKVSDTRRAEAQIKRLEGLLKGLAEEQVPQLKGRVKRARVGESSFLTLNLDGSLVPWDEVPIKEVEDKEGEFDPLIKKLKESTLVISLGVRGNYLLLSVGPSTEALAGLGKGPLLAERPELRPLDKFATRRLTGISYVSKAFMAKVSTTREDLEGLVSLARAGLEKADLPEEKRKQIEKDVAAFAKDLERTLPEPGAQVGFNFLTERGYEGYTYDYARHPRLDGSKPLTILSHLGGTPVLAGATRVKRTGRVYQTIAKWVKVAHGHADDILKEKLPEEQRKKYEEISKAFLPFVRQADQVTAKLLVPSLADGQMALVLDARWASKQWHKNLPETDRALPLPEIALVLGMSNAGQFRKALEEYRAIANDAIAKARELAPEGQVPPFEIPAAQNHKVKGGTLFYYSLPGEAGLDAQVVPTLGLGSHVAVLAPSNGMAERLLAAKPLQVEGGPLADAQRHLTGAAYFNWPGLVDAATPWVEFALDRSPLPRGDGEEGAPPGLGDVRKQVRTVLEVLKCHRGASSATYFEGEVLVTHLESVFRDLAGPAEK
jgi:hypothetical protein